MDISRVNLPNYRDTVHGAVRQNQTRWTTCISGTCATLASLEEGSHLCDPCIFRGGQCCLCSPAGWTRYRSSVSDDLW